jgi:hypothetical protein
MFLRNVGLISTACTAIYPRKQKPFTPTAVRNSNPTTNPGSRNYVMAKWLPENIITFKPLWGTR